MKELFEESMIEIIHFNAEDIIKTSGIIDNVTPDDPLPFALWLEDEDDMFSFIIGKK